jgi:hypothetical protein
MSWEAVTKEDIESAPELAVEDRFQASILLAGGYYTGGVDLPEADPLNFAPRVCVPPLMTNGRIGASGLVSVAIRTGASSCGRRA